MNPSLVASAAAVLTIGGLLIAAAIAATGHPRAAVACGFELWMAAGLLRLSSSRSWRAILVAAVVVVLRRVLSRALLRPAPARPATRDRHQAGTGA